MTIPGRASAIVFTTHAAITKRLMTHEMNKTRPGFQDGDFKSKVSIIPPYSIPTNISTIDTRVRVQNVVSVTTCIIESSNASG